MVEDEFLMAKLDDMKGEKKLDEAFRVTSGDIQIGHSPFMSNQRLDRLEIFCRPHHGFCIIRSSCQKVTFLRLELHLRNNASMGGYDIDTLLLSQVPYAARVILASSG